MSFANDLYLAVEPGLVVVIGGAVVGILFKGYARLCTYLGIAQDAAIMSKQAAAAAVVSTAIDDVASSAHSDIMAGKVQLSQASIKKEAVARLNEVYAKAPAEIAASGINPGAIALSLGQQILGKVAAAGLVVPDSKSGVLNPANGDNPPTPIPSVLGAVSVTGAAAPIPVSLVGKA